MSGCWKWLGMINQNRYGVSGRGKLAHRASWEMFKYPIPKGLFVLHKCDNPACVNPDHLFLGTHQDNMRDMVSKGRQAKGEPFRKIMKRVAARGATHMSITHPEIVRRGQQVFGVRLTEIEVLKIRELYKNKGITQKRLGILFGVNQSQISDAVNKITWKHI